MLEEKLAEKTVCFRLLADWKIYSITPLGAITLVLTVSGFYSGALVSLVYVLDLLIFFMVLNTISQFLWRNAYAMDYNSVETKNFGLKIGFSTRSINIQYILIIFLIFASLMISLSNLSQALNLFLISATIATLGTITVQILINFALPFYSRKFRKRDIIFHIVLPIIAMIFLLDVLYASLVGVTFPVAFAPIIFFTWGVIGYIVVLIIGRDRNKLEKIGSMGVDF